MANKSIASPKPKVIANLLIKTLKLPEDVSLIEVFGNGHESNDVEAMQTWLNSFLPVPPQSTFTRLRQIADQIDEENRHEQA